MMKNFSSTLVKNFYANNATKIIVAFSLFSVVAMISFAILNRDSVELYVLHFGCIMVGLISALPMIPAIFVNDYKI